MFDKLVESTKQKQQGRSRFYLVTSLIYGTSLSALAVGTIIWFNPAMAEANTTAMLLAPPPVPVAAPPPELAPATKVQPDPGFIEPKTPPKEIMEATKVPPKPPSVRTGPLVPGVPDAGNNDAASNGFQRGPNFGEVVDAAPLPTPKPTPKAEPTPTPTPKPQEIVRMTSEMITGKAIRKVQPPYPQIARAVRAQGTVSVQITISEEGRVISASVIGGHPTLQQAAQQAATQWVFSPTVLNGKPVKVSGVIAFNFILN